MSALSKKVTIITGASSGIGYATAKPFAREGTRLVVAARRRPELDALVEEVAQAGGRAVALVGDVKDERFAKDLVDLAKAEFGGFQVAFSNAGTMEEMGATPDVSLSEREGTNRTNLTSAFLGAKYQIPAMLERGGGSLIFTSTLVGYTVGFPGTAAYAVSKAGLVGLTQTLASEFGARGSG